MYKYSFTLNNNEKYVNISYDEIGYLIKQGKLTKDTFIWRKEFIREVGMKADNIPELKEFFILFENSPKEEPCYLFSDEEFYGFK